MSTKSLPPNPTIRQLKIQAKEFLKSQKNGDIAVCETLRLLHRFSNSTGREILDANISLKDVQFAIALSYGFKGWEQLAEYVESIQADRIKGIKEYLSKQLDELDASTPEELSKEINDYIRKHLKRIEDGQYGICEKRGGRISTELLKVTPFRRECIKCSSNGKASEKDIGDLFCSFCAKNQAEIEKLIPGSNVYICNECVRLCFEILFEQELKSDSSQKSKKEGNLHCSFCGKHQKEVKKMIASPNVCICDECVERFNDIIKVALEQEAT